MFNYICFYHKDDHRRRLQHLYDDLFSVCIIYFNLKMKKRLKGEHLVLMSIEFDIINMALLSGVQRNHFIEF